MYMFLLYFNPAHLLSIFENCMQDADHIGLMSKSFQAKDAFQLLQANYYSSASHETSNGGM